MTAGMPPDVEARVERFIELGETRVSTQIADDDEMFEASHEHYFSVGRSALDVVRVALTAAGKQKVDNILDLPCGHGRVLRYLRAAFPEATLTACDLSRSGVDFCAEAFDAIPVYGAEREEEIDLPMQYDLIWCGSLVTHFDAARFRSFVRFFVSRLADGGILVLTTHGRRAVERIVREGDTYSLDARALRRLVREHQRRGFGYADYPQARNYGVSLSSLWWVCRLFEEMSNVRIVHVGERAWDDHHDVIAVRRTSS